MAQEVWPSGAKLLVPSQRERGGRGGRWHKKFGPLGPNFLCRLRGSGDGEGQTAQEVWPSRAKSLVPPQREQEGRGDNIMDLSLPVAL